jgi:Uma2 family endonuclease
MPQVIEVVEKYIIPDFPTLDLPEEDGIPLESNWHRIQMNLLVDIVRYRWRQRQDFFAGGNMFIYYSVQQIRNREYKGPDFFVVKDIDGSYPRQKWVVWEENARFPNMIVELLSAFTAQDDLGHKKELYERIFRTPDYFCYDPESDQLWGWSLQGGVYTSLTADAQGRLWSAELDAWVGRWSGLYQQEQAIWLRLFDESGHLLPTEAEAERQRVETAEAELARLRAELARQQGNRPDGSDLSDKDENQ